METLEPEKTSGGGLCVPRKDRMVFRAPERKSLLGVHNLQVYDSIPSNCTDFSPCSFCFLLYLGHRILILFFCANWKY